MIVRITTLLAATVLSVIPAAAMAQAAGYETTRMEVRSSDLDLSTASGQAALRARIASAVRSVCDVTSGGMNLQEIQGQRRCTSNAHRAALVAAGALQTARVAAK